ncbi:M56 family metallopeptidase, partial [candidate division KSB1 bacterium]|nr:M56 family metallopeptidase [candidate division KSB1 bacterium]
METILNTPWLFTNAKTALSFLFIITLKSAVIILVAYILTRSLRRAAAATRHLIWTMALVSILLLPIFSLLLPSWDVPFPNNIFPVSQREEAGISKPTAILNEATFAKGAEISQAVEPGVESGSKAGLLGEASRRPGPGVSGENKSSWLSSFSLKQWPIFLLSVWVLGTVLIMGRHFAGRLFIWWVARKAPEITDDALQKLFGKLSARLGIRRPVKILRSPKTTMPMTWGILQPKILFPSESSKWSSARKRFVLLHELAHVKRMDTLTQLLAQLVHAIYWMNPLIWVANRHLLKEREYACDDCVLSEGSKASEYANLLLEFARSLQVGRFSSLATVAMARRSQLEGRMLAILDPRLSRGVLTPLAVLLSSVAIFSLVLPLAAMRPAAAETQFSEVLTENMPAQKTEELGNSTRQVKVDDWENSVLVERKTTEVNTSVNLNTSVTNYTSRNSNSNSTSNTNSNSDTNSNSNFKSRSNTYNYSISKNKTKYKGYKKLSRNQNQDDTFVI